ncbi:transglutaminase domain-containing protein [Niastella caeni]|uniref:Transglutaminase domain-containing protein n=1 Tax=Niastella caeni TaxID=2569763 RepID=A0A4S8HAM4_9BACT|nr:transglutaminase-like domain-containing protein [Niastella caeni]THU31139.1 transglutaminase domain-containing protein [Niastella caeni]
MDFSYAVVPGYNHLYDLNEQIRITRFTHNDHRSVSIAFSGSAIKKVNEFKVYHNNVLLTEVKAPELTFQPLPGGRKYYIKVNDLPGDVIIEMDHTPDSVYRKAGNSGGGAFEVTGSNIPIESGHTYSVNDWALTFDDFNSEADNKEAALYLKDSMNIMPDDSSAERVLKITHFVLQRVKGMDGVPNDALFTLSPVNQLKYVQAGKSKLWCGNYTSIFAFFACKAGVPVRLVSCGDGINGNISTGGHVFAEVWLKEINRWSYVDLLARTVSIKKGDQFLNVIDVSRLLKYPGDDPDLVAAYFDGDSIVQKPFSQVAHTARYYFHKDNSFRFYFNDFLKRQIPKNLLERGKKIFYTRPYYAMYGDNLAIGQSQFMFRIITTYGLFLLLALCLFFGFKSFRKHKAAIK